MCPLNLNKLLRLDIKKFEAKNVRFLHLMSFLSLHAQISYYKESYLIRTEWVEFTHGYWNVPKLTSCDSFSS